MPPILPALAPGKGDTNSGALQGCGCRRCHADRVVSGRALDDDAVAARARIEVQLVVRGLRTEDVDRRPDAADRDATADSELACGRRALDVDDVGSPVVRQVGA